MAVGVSSISQVCRSLAQQLSTSINGTDRSRIDVLVGTPSSAAPAETDTNHRLNLFFFRFEPFGFDTDMLPGDTWLLRAQCLMTPFCIDEAPTTAGENDLRVLGEVLRYFHEQPVFLLTVEDEQFQIQVICLSMGLDQLNQLWSTQGDTVYRPSALYEISLAPVIPLSPTIQPKRVGSLGLDVRATMSATTISTTPATPAVAAMQPSTSKEDWAPALCLVSDGQCLQAASLELGSDALADFAPEAWIAGVADDEVHLRWETWDSESGWRSEEAGDAIVITDIRIDPDEVASATTTAVALPFDDRAGQMALYAERTYRRAVDGVEITVRSNPVLLTIYEAA